MVNIQGRQALAILYQNKALPLSIGTFKKSKWRGKKNTLRPSPSIYRLAGLCFNWPTSVRAFYGCTWENCALTQQQHRASPIKANRILLVEIPAVFNTFWTLFDQSRSWSQQEKEQRNVAPWSLDALQPQILKLWILWTLEATLKIKPEISYMWIHARQDAPGPLAFKNDVGNQISSKY